jgi:hypothetical protein
MRVRTVFLLATGLAGILAAQQAAPQSTQPDPVFDAMQAELKRSLTLELGQLEHPYYLSYAVDDEHVWSATAILGGLIGSNTSSFRAPSVRVRVGDYKFDNTNWAGARARGPGYDLRDFPLDDDNPLVLRQYLWLATDSAYKGSLQSIARKRAALRNVTVSDQITDFAPAPSLVLVHDYTPVKFDDKTWADRVRGISAIFTGFPALRSSQASFEAIDSLHRFVSSEGTRIRVQEPVGSFELRASAQSSDGMIVRDLDLFYTRDAAKMFPEADLAKAARDMAQQVTKLAAAPMGDNYTGPVLFEGVASAQMLAEVLGRNLHITRKPVTAQGGSAQGGAAQAAATDLEGRRGVRIMPEMFDVTDDPTLPSFGYEEVDDEGVAEHPVSLVEKGVLKDFLRTRQPVRGYAESNGRARLAGNYGAEVPSPTNLIIKSRETSSIADLKKKLIDLIQQRDLPYALIVRKMDFPSSAGLDEARKILAAAGSNRPVSIPLYVYRLYPDGREELVRGERFRGLNARSLKDILAAGDDSVTFNYLDNGEPFSLLGYGSTAAAVSVVAPSVLIDDLELTKVDDELPRLPVVPAPVLTSQTASGR